MIVKLLKKLMILMVVSLVFYGIEIVVALLISGRLDTSLQDIMTMEGIVVTVVGLIASMKGASSGASFSGMASNVGDMTSFANLQHVRLERGGDSYQKSFLQNAIVEYGLFRFAIIVSGLLMLLGSWIFF